MLTDGWQEVLAGEGDRQQLVSALFTSPPNTPPAQKHLREPCSPVSRTASPAPTLPGDRWALVLSLLVTRPDCEPLRPPSVSIHPLLGLMVEWTIQASGGTEWGHIQV